VSTLLESIRNHTNEIGNNDTMVESEIFKPTAPKTIKKSEPKPDPTKTVKKKDLQLIYDKIQEIQPLVGTAIDCGNSQKVYVYLQDLLKLYKRKLMR